ncbi:hypothetical protein [Azotobacter vinelandii]|uniref:hypothetical protein n=1 Tax=Azotobacter vinelandii TaxID=354 RepID=UPI0007741AAB|nr:hypothetical protein [Azotobacter vinelandii]WKN21543.1 hypothetical protein AVAEIV_004644 [Azotobacter vinelandii]
MLENDAEKGFRQRMTPVETIFDRKRLLRICLSLCLGEAMTAMAETPAPPEPTRVEGRLVEGGIVCPLLRTGDGEVLPLTGIGMDDYPLATRLTLDGVFVRVSPCMQGKRTLQVRRVLKVEEP